MQKRKNFSNTIANTLHTLVYLLFSLLSTPNTPVVQAAKNDNCTTKEFWCCFVHFLEPRCHSIAPAEVELTVILLLCPLSLRITGMSHCVLTMPIPQSFQEGKTELPCKLFTPSTFQF